MFFIIRLIEYFTKKNQLIKHGVNFDIPILLNEDAIAKSDYIFVFDSFPGWGGRSLNRTILVDTNFCYEAHFHAYEKSNISNERINIVIKGQLPTSIKNILTEILTTPNLINKLNRNYGVLMQDVGHTSYHFKQNSKVIDVFYYAFVPDSNKLKYNLTEIKFIELKNEIQKWSEKIYTFFLNEI